jgi:hypothetical protein
VAEFRCAPQHGAQPGYAAIRPSSPGPDALEKPQACGGLIGSAAKRADRFQEASTQAVRLAAMAAGHHPSKNPQTQPMSQMASAQQMANTARPQTMAPRTLASNLATSYAPPWSYAPHTCTHRLKA